MSIREGRHRRRLVELRNSPWLVSGVVLAGYLWWITAGARHGYDIRYYVYFGTRFLTLAHSSAIIGLPSDSRKFVPNPIGFDGQFAYYLAVDPVHARDYMDDPAYRYSRILYPMVARAFSLGRPGLVPYVLVIINLVAISGGTLALACWLRRKGLSPWFALVYGLYPGMFIAVHRDLNEPLAYALVALAIYLFDFGGKHRVLWASVCFALAILARESTFVFPVLYGLPLLLRGSNERSWRERLMANWRGALLFLAVALLPMVAYKAFLLVWLGSLGFPPSNSPTIIPFGGILSYPRPLPPDQLDEVFYIAAPALLCAVIALRALWKRVWPVEVWILLAAVQLYVVMLAAPSWVSYEGSTRVSAQVIIAALLCIPSFDRVLPATRSWLWVGTVLWFLPWYSLLPFAVGGS